MVLAPLMSNRKGAMPSGVGGRRGAQGGPGWAGERIRLDWRPRVSLRVPEGNRFLLGGERGRKLGLNLEVRTPQVSFRR